MMNLFSLYCLYALRTWYGVLCKCIEIASCTFSVCLLVCLLTSLLMILLYILFSAPSPVLFSYYCLFLLLFYSICLSVCLSFVFIFFWLAWLDTNSYASTYCILCMIDLFCYLFILFIFLLACVCASTNIAFFCFCYFRPGYTWLLQVDRYILIIKLASSSSGFPLSLNLF